METVQQAKNNFSALRAEGREIVYPAKCKSVNAKDKHKEKTLCGNPEVLFTDYAQQREGRKKNNLIFFTDSIYIWKDTLCSKYAHVSREGIGSGGRLQICKDEHLDKDDPLLTITYYTKGKVMVQGNEANLDEGDESPIENPNTLSISAPPTPASSNNRLKESVALLELDFAEFKERTQARQAGTPDNTLQQLKEDLQQLRATTRPWRLTSEELAKVREDAECREKSFTRQVQHLREDAESTAHNTLAPPDTHSQKGQLPTASSAHPSLPLLSLKNKTHKWSCWLTQTGSSWTQERLFPDKKVLSKHCSTTGQVLSKPCSTTGQAMKLLKKETLRAL
ncbi:hypothetical protein KUCAC02_008889, partial [Chaenocephalus aceratus]